MLVPDMPSKLGLRKEGFFTDVTRKAFHATVHEHVIVEQIFSRKLFIAQTTRKWLLPGVN